MSDERGRRWDATFGVREWMAVAVIVVGIVGQWYTTRVRLDYAIERLGSLEGRLANNQTGMWTIDDHARYAAWMERELDAILARVDRLESEGP